MSTSQAIVVTLTIETPTNVEDLILDIMERFADQPQRLDPRLYSSVVAMAFNAPTPLFHDACGPVVLTMDVNADTDREDIVARFATAYPGSTPVLYDSPAALIAAMRATNDHALIA